MLSSPSPANHGAICYPTTWLPTRQAHAHTNTHANAQKHTASLIPGTVPLLSHRDTHIKLHRHRCSPKVSTLNICTKACTQAHLIARSQSSQHTSRDEDTLCLRAHKKVTHTSYYRRGCVRACVWCVVTVVRHRYCQVERTMLCSSVCALAGSA